MAITEIKRFAAQLPAIAAAAETKQGLAKALRHAARPVVSAARPRSEADVRQLETILARELPATKLGQFARARVREIAMLPWQIAMFGGYGPPGQLRDFDGSTQYGSYSGSPSSWPISMSCWFNADSFFGYPMLVSLTDFSATENTETVLMYLNQNGGSIVVDVVSGADYGHIVSTTGTSTGTLTHAAAVFASDTSRSAYINGGSKATDTTSAAIPSGLDTTGIATFLYSSGPFELLDGTIGEAAIWTAELSDAEVAALARGVSPLNIQPGSLWAYWPLLGVDSPEPDQSGNSRNLTLTGF